MEHRSQDSVGLGCSGRPGSLAGPPLVFQPVLFSGPNTRLTVEEPRGKVNCVCVAGSCAVSALNRKLVINGVRFLGVLQLRRCRGLGRALQSFLVVEEEVPGLRSLFVGWVSQSGLYRGPLVLMSDEQCHEGDSPRSR